MMKENGGSNFGQLLLNVFEYQAHSGRDGYRWDGEGFYGGDINRLWLKSEGEGEFGRGIDTAEVQVLYSRDTLGIPGEIVDAVASVLRVEGS